MEFKAMFDMIISGMRKSYSEDYDFKYSVWLFRCVWHVIYTFLGDIFLIGFMS
jgi:hypothetical protein